MFFFLNSNIFKLFLNWLRIRNFVVNSVNNNNNENLWSIFVLMFYNAPVHIILWWIYVNSTLAALIIHSINTICRKKIIQKIHNIILAFFLLLSSLQYPLSRPYPQYWRCRHRRWLFYYNVTSWQEVLVIYFTYIV